jgi:Na+-transporting NADH:ubiquinone oxidoreductase subunit NqrE
LTPAAVFWINSLGVWVLDIILLYLSFFVDLSWSLPMIYIAVLNGITHIMATLRSRRYNPGLWTSIFLFLPLGTWSTCVVSAASHATWCAHALGVAAAIQLHLLIIAYIFRPKTKDQGLPATL